MKEILETIIKNLVDNPEAVEIKEVENEKTITFEVKAAEEDMGKIIGRQGKIAQSIRTVMKAVANRKDKKVNVEFICLSFEYSGNCCIISYCLIVIICAINLPFNKAV